MEKKTLQQKLELLPDEIFQKQILIKKMTEENQDLKFLMSSMEFNEKESIKLLCDENGKPMFKSMAAIDRECKHRLVKDSDYQERKKFFDLEEKKIKTEKLKLEYLMNQKSCYCALARLGDFESYIKIN